jgi:hypothetical protein
MKLYILTSLAAFGLACSSPPAPPVERIYDTWEVMVRETLATDENVKRLSRGQYTELVKLASEGLGRHRYEFRRSGELAFGSELLKAIAHFKITGEDRGRLILELKDVGQGNGRVETGQAWFVGEHLHVARGSQVLVLKPD